MIGLLIQAGLVVACLGSYDVAIGETDRPDAPTYYIAITDAVTGQLVDYTETDGDIVHYAPDSEWYGSPSPIADRLLSAVCGVHIDSDSISQK